MAALAADHEAMNAAHLRSNWERNDGASTNQGRTEFRSRGNAWIDRDAQGRAKAILELGWHYRRARAFRWTTQQLSFGADRRQLDMDRQSRAAAVEVHSRTQWQAVASRGQ